MWVKNCIIAPPFMDGWIKTQLGARTFKQLQTAESFPLLLKPLYGIIASEADENKKCRLLLAIGNGNNIYISSSQGSRLISSHVTP